MLPHKFSLHALKRHHIKAKMVRDRTYQFSLWPTSLTDAARLHPPHDLIDQESPPPFSPPKHTLPIPTRKYFTPALFKYFALRSSPASSNFPLYASSHISNHSSPTHSPTSSLHPPRFPFTNCYFSSLPLPLLPGQGNFQSKLQVNTYHFVGTFS